MEEGFTFFRKRTLVSTKPTQPSCKIHELSTLDRTMENHHLKIVYYYDTPLLGSHIGEMTSKIRANLSEMLNFYPVVIGRLMKNDKQKWVIKCNDAGLRIIEARAKGSLHDWLENIDDEKEKKLIHWEDMCENPYLWSTFYVKVTEFEEGGLALALSCSHMIADPICATMFMKALTNTVLCGRISIPPFFHPLPQHKLVFQKSNRETKNYLINGYKSILENPSPLVAQNYKTVTLEFKDRMVQSCMKSAQLNGPIKDTYSSVFVALVGLLWNCISRVKGVKHGLVNISICSNMRKILGLDQGFFGNCMVYNRVDGNGIRVDDLMSTTKAIEEAMGNISNEKILGLIEWLENYDGGCSPPPVSGDNSLVFVDLEDTDPYSSTFIEGYEPVRVSYYNESIVGNEMVLILPSRPNEGQLSRIVMVTLPSDEAIKICEDRHLARYSPVIITGPKHR